MADASLRSQARIMDDPAERAAYLGRKAIDSGAVSRAAPVASRDATNEEVRTAAAAARAREHAWRRDRLAAYLVGELAP